MRLYRAFKITFACILLCYTLPTNIVHAQEQQGYRWGKWSRGVTSAGGGLMDAVVDSYIDSVGNTYIFGKFGMDARLGVNGPKICPMDTCAVEMGYMIGISQGVFLAKIDSLGNILWCKSARNGSQNSGCGAWDNMVVKDNKITIAFGNSNGSEWWNWFYFFDTMLIEPSYPVGQSDRRTYFVTFDLEGNRLDYHSIQMFAYTDPEYIIYSNTFFSGQSQLKHTGYFLCDDDDNIHIFAFGDFYGEDSLHKAYIIVDDDTNRKYPLNIRTLNGNFYSSTVYYKMDSNWNLVGSRFMIDSITVWNPSGSHYANINIEEAIIDGDDIYANGFFNSNDFSFSIDTQPVRVYLDSIHYLRIDNTQDWVNMPFLLKLNRDGEVVWVQQLYNENESTRIPPTNYTDAGGIATDENNVYVYYLVDRGYDTKFYLDSSHNTRLPQGTFDAHSYSLVVSYNRNTGLPVEYYVVDTVNDCNVSHNSLAVLGDELLLNVYFGYNHTIKKTALCRINKYSKEVTRSSPITYNFTNIGCKNMSVNDHGWVFRGETGDEPRVYDSIFLGNYQEASVMTFFYDSTLDMRRPRPCYAVDSLWCDGAVGQTVTLSWRSRFPHPEYELAYIPEGGGWDDATLMQISDTTATVTLSDGQCHLFRVRGLCEGNRVAHSPWSSIVTVCPQVGINEIENSKLKIEIFPNPTDGTVQILGLPDERVTVEVMDMKGRWVKTIENTSTFNVSDLASGVYIVHVKTRPGSSVPEKNIYLELVKK